MASSCKRLGMLATLGSQRKPSPITRRSLSDGWTTSLCRLLRNGRKAGGGEQCFRLGSVSYIGSAHGSSIDHDKATVSIPHYVEEAARLRRFLG